jgi:hypothetical protein
MDAIEIAPHKQDEQPAAGLRRVWRLLQGRAAPKPTCFLTRWLFLRLLGLVYLFAFGALWPQVRGLIGPSGILPAGDYLRAFGGPGRPASFWQLPTLAWLDTSDGFLLFLCGAGMVLALLLIAGLLPGPALALLWLDYLSIANIGQDFLAFQWDSLLLETGFLAIFFAPWGPRPGLAREAPPSRLVLWLLRLLLFRLVFFSGVVKLASGDPTWHNLTALSYHWWTQPLPTPVAWYLHQLPDWFQSLSTAFTFVAELFAPLLIFAPRRVRFLGAALMIALQLLIMLTGNFAFFNLLTIALCVPLLDDALLSRIFPPDLRVRLLAHFQRRTAPVSRRLIVVPMAVLLLLLSWAQVSRQIWLGVEVPLPVLELNGRLAPWQLVNSYGLFAVMTTEREEVIVEGSDDGTHWREYTFFAKPVDVRRAPAWVAPYHPRLDWQLWFAPFGGPGANPWLSNFLRGLLRGSPQVRALLPANSFPQAPPRYVRASLYSYQFTDILTRAATGAWWQRRFVGSFIAPMSLSSP